MKFKALSKVLLVTIFLTAFAMPSQAATIAGTKCSKVGTTKTTGGLKHFCVKSGKNLIWNKGTAVRATPTPKKTKSVTPSKTPAVTQSPTPTRTKTASPTASSGLTKLTIEEVSKNASATSCWSIIYGNVFNLTKWIGKHPGGAEKIRAICGKDGTNSFERQHTGDGGAANQLSAYFLGKLGDSVKL
jgi:cytochrome b involved in lipid metabolism